ncbi:glycosyltransferase family 2 protein [Silanimonas lenta]|uniref:glycosyltransferase family 2 protein n=1 Tax=Silanimonas lenta TaxID=265429 RepID=UPI0004140D36|nr:glycosyltransferase family 2 protein [Silanimonas lenta]
MTAAQGSGGVDAVVVAYDSASTLEACLHSLLAQPPLVRLVVVDNGSRDDSRARVRAMAAGEPRLSLLELDHNPGFAAACNAGAAAGDSPWLLFVNPDCELPQGTLERLLAHAAAVPTPGALGADLRDAEGRRDAAARRHDLSLGRLLAARGGRDALALPVEEGRALQPVEACSGALMLVPRVAFERIGGWDAGYRLHVEDLDFCRRLRAAGFSVAVANDVPVLHHRGVSSRARPLFVEWHKHRGLWRYWRRFEAPGRAWAWRPLVALALAARFTLIALPRAMLGARSRRRAR